MTKAGYGKLTAALSKNKGGLHRALHIPEGQKIPADKLAAAKNSKKKVVREEANLAATARGFKHKGKRAA